MCDGALVPHGYRAACRTPDGDSLRPCGGAAMGDGDDDGWCWCAAAALRWAMAICATNTPCSSRCC